MPDNAQLDPELIDSIKREAAQMVQDAGKLIDSSTGLYKRYKEIYFMNNPAKPKGNATDDNDWAVTISPTGRNAVTGMKRLLDTSEVHVTVKVEGDKADTSDDIEKGLKHILTQSGMYRRARVEKDLNLSAVLFGPAVIACEFVGDLLAMQQGKEGDSERAKKMKAAYRRRLEYISRYTPFLLQAINPEQSFSKWGEIGMLAHLRRYSVTGDIAQERWGVENLSRNQKYNVFHWLDLENTVAWIEGQRDVLTAKPHGMPSLNVAARFAGGTSLFDDADQQMQSFLYAHTKGEWDKRENLFFTYLFTALFMQGLPGPLIGVDPESLPNGEVNVNYQGGVRTIIGKVQPVNMPVVSNDVLAIKNILDAINDQSTIYKQTLGQNISGSTFSGLSMLSAAGQLPLEDPKEAIAFAYRDIFCHILDRIRGEGIENNLIHPEDIPDSYELEVSLEPKLPQDNLRNAQIVQSLGDLVSDEFKHNLLQIGDSKAERRKVMSEQLQKGLFGAMMQDPNRVNQLLDFVMNSKKPAAPEIAAGPTPPEPQQIPSQSPDQMTQAAVPMQGMLGAEQMPMQNPLPMPGEPGGEMPQ